MRLKSAFRLLLLLGTLFSVTSGSVGQSTDYAIAHVTIINPGSGKTQPDTTIVIHEHSILSVVPAKDFKPSPSIRVIDGSGKFLIPGLWDMHAHFRDANRDLKMDIANGVLGIRNMGEAAKTVFPLRDAIARGQRLGPKIVACGPIVDGPDSQVNPQFLISVKNAREARSAVDSLKKQGSDCIKVHDNISRDSYYAVVEEAKKVGLPLVGHCPGSIRIREASDAGQRSLEHGVALGGGSMVADEFLEKGADNSVFEEALRTKNFGLIPAAIARDENKLLDHFSQERADATYALLAKNNTFLTPTLVTERALTFIDDLEKENDPRKQYVSAEDLKWWKPENGMLTKYRTPEYIAMRKREYAKILEELPRAQKLGVRLLAGTDITIPYTFPGFSVHDELGLFVKAGLTPMQALETATTNPALILGLSKTWGRIERRYVANLVLLNADPLADIANTEKIDAVVLNGKFLDRTRLDQLLRQATIPAAPHKSTLH